MERVEFVLDEVRDLAKTRPGTNQEESFENAPKEGWDEGLGMGGAQDAIIKGVTRERVTSIAAEVRRNIRFREVSDSTEVLARSGRMIDRQRYRRGAPKCFWNKKIRRRPDPVVHVGFSIAANCHVSSDVWIQRGAALLSLLNEARNEGLSVALDACIPIIGLFERGGGDIFIAVRIKPAGASLSQGVLNFWAAHSAAFRRIGFRLMEEVAKRRNKNVDFGYGRSSNEDHPDVTGDYDLWIPQWDHTKESEEVISTAQEWTEIIKDEK